MFSLFSTSCSVLLDCGWTEEMDPDMLGPLVAEQQPSGARLVDQVGLQRGGRGSVVDFTVFLSDRRVSVILCRSAALRCMALRVLPLET